MNTKGLVTGVLASVALGYLWVSPPEVWGGQQLFAYKPPLRGAPAGSTRVGGGTRGAAERTFALSVLAPDHTGLTGSQQPTLYWFASDTITNPVEITIVDEESIDPVLELELAPPLSAGIHALDLVKHNVNLKPDVPYQWFVTIVTDPSHPSNDIVAGGEVRRVQLSDDVRSKVDNATGERERTQAYADAGLWYDTIDGVSELIAAAPEDTGLREQRAVLLAQVGLAQAAAYERAQLHK